MSYVSFADAIYRHTVTSFTYLAPLSYPRGRLRREREFPQGKAKGRNSHRGSGKEVCVQTKSLHEEGF